MFLLCRMMFHMRFSIYIYIYSLGPWVMDVLLGAVLLFARHADTDTYWTSKISSGRGSKCSGKKTKTWLGKSMDLTRDLHCSNGVVVKCLEEIGCLSFE